MFWDVDAHACAPIPNPVDPIRNLDPRLPYPTHPMPVDDYLMTIINSTYQMLAHGNYQQFVETLEKMRDGGMITQDALDDLLPRFPDPRPSAAPAWEQDEGAEIYLRNPPDLEPLATLPFRRGWMDEKTASSLSMSTEKLSQLIGPWGEDVLSDIQANSLQILNGCNDPRRDGVNWGTNKQGLVFGPVQSGKTASMLSLIQVGMRAGYRLFIVLAGDKTSLRDQTQNRVNKAFGLRGGWNDEDKIHSPTHTSDFRHLKGGYTANFRFHDRVARGQKLTTIIVMKKRTEHLKSLVSQLIDYHQALPDGVDPATQLPAMILDDEADYASQDTDKTGPGSTTHNDLVRLRSELPRNCYVGYTATPQANLMASPDDPIGYPKDFWWMIEPFTDKDEDGIRRPRTYLGPWEVFWEYDTYLLHKMGRNEWPHHEKSPMGVPLGVYFPSHEIDGEGYHTTRLPDHEAHFLEQVLSSDPEERRNPPPVIRRAIMDFIITCGVRWWREWLKKGLEEKPSKDEISRSYGHHAMIVHLSLLKENQEMVRKTVEMEWPGAVEAFDSFDPKMSPDDHPFRERWRLQTERTRALRGSSFLPYDEISYFMRSCIDIATEPIFDSRQGSPYTTYNNDPWIYLLNSSDEGMELNYSPDADWQIRTKRAAIIVGGNILSRGLTVEGLSVTVFGRTSQGEMMDTVLQRGRWFGHKMGQIDITAIHMQDEPREVFRQIAEADRYLRLQIKQALHEGHTPLEVLVELRNSPFISPTSGAKSKYLSKNKGFGFAGKRAMLTTPSFDPADILANDELIQDFLSAHADEEVHGRGAIAWDVDPNTVIKLLTALKCDKAAPQVSFRVLADYLKGWRTESNNGEAPPLPAMNVVVMNEGRRQRRLSDTNHPYSMEEAQQKVTRTFGAVVGGMDGAGRYKGDYFIDRPIEWHDDNSKPSKTRKAGEDMLLVFYRLDPNYIRKTYWDETKRSDENPHGKMVTKEILVPKKLPNGRPHPLYVPSGTHVITYAAWVPEGGPMYSVGTNRLIDQSRIKQRGLAQLQSPEED